MNTKTFALLSILTILVFTGSLYSAGSMKSVQAQFSAPWCYQSSGSYQPPPGNCYAGTYTVTYSWCTASGMQHKTTKYFCDTQYGSGWLYNEIEYICINVPECQT